MTSSISVGCRHHWMIESANSPISRGVCKYCGEKRGFYNSWEDYIAQSYFTRVSEPPELPSIEPDNVGSTV